MATDKKFLAVIEATLTKATVNEKIIDYVIAKVKQSFRNGVEVGIKQASTKQRA
jgi:hypothetical protein